MTAGVDEVGIAPLRERMRSALVERVGISRRKATMTVLLTVVTVELRSFATVSSTTTSNVMVKLTVNAPVSNTVMVALRREMPTRSTSAERMRSRNGAMPTSSTPAVMG
ncbi:MAG: hypothetical protein ACKOIZ_01615, partial [Actinomycetota bacterium]